MIIPDCPCLVPAWYVPVFSLLIFPFMTLFFPCSFFSCPCFISSFFRDKQGQSLFTPVCPCMSLSVPICPFLSLFVPSCLFLSLLVPSFPGLLLSVPVCPSLPMSDQIMGGFFSAPLPTLTNSQAMYKLNCPLGCSIPNTWTEFG